MRLNFGGASQIAQGQIGYKNAPAGRRSCTAEAAIEDFEHMNTFDLADLVKNTGMITGKTGIDRASLRQHHAG
jgi:hypothetical protein